MENSSRLPALDGLRGLAILLVVGFHYVSTPLHGGGFLASLSALLRFGWTGVDLFFVLSGYLTVGRLRQAPPGRWQSFFYRRAVRILPLYYLVLGPALVLSRARWPPHFARLFDNASPLPYLGLWQNFSLAAGRMQGPISMGSWALATEVQAYLLLGWGATRLSPRRFRQVLWVSLLTFPLLRLGLPYLGLNPAVAPFVLRADGIAMGALLALSLHLPPRLESRPLTTHWLWYGWACLATSMGAMAYGQRAQGFLPFLSTEGMRALGYTLIAAFYSSLLWLVLQEPSATVWSPLKSRTLRKLGELSYAIFLFHQGVNGWIHALFFHSPARWQTFPQLGATLLAIGVTLMLAEFSQRWIERPLRERSSWLFSKLAATGS